jgi:hypothetical protein
MSWSINIMDCADAIGAAARAKAGEFTLPIQSEQDLREKVVQLIEAYGAANTDGGRMIGVGAFGSAVVRGNGESHEVNISFKPAVVQEEHNGDDSE